MLPFSSPVIEIIRQRYSCRGYNKTPIAAEHASQLGAFAESIQRGPLGTSLRFELIAATEQDRGSLRGLGTYGLIKDPGGFIAGAVGQGKNKLEDFGLRDGNRHPLRHQHRPGDVLARGNFTKSSFSRKIQATRGEIVPAVASIGYPAEGSAPATGLRQQVKSDTRLAWEALFFRSDFGHPLSRESTGVYAGPAGMLRLAPSAHNFQPWRVIQDGSCYHFYLQRTQGLGPAHRCLSCWHSGSATHGNGDRHVSLRIDGQRVRPGREVGGTRASRRATGQHVRICCNLDRWRRTGERCDMTGKSFCRRTAELRPPRHPRDWRAWLAENHGRAEGVWLSATRRRRASHASSTTRRSRRRSATAGSTARLTSSMKSARCSGSPRASRAQAGRSTTRSAWRS